MKPICLPTHDCTLSTVNRVPFTYGSRHPGVLEDIGRPPLYVGQVAGSYRCTRLEAILPASIRLTETHDRPHEVPPMSAQHGKPGTPIRASPPHPAAPVSTTPELSGRLRKPSFQTPLGSTHARALILEPPTPFPWVRLHHDALDSILRLLRRARAR